MCACECVISVYTCVCWITHRHRHTHAHRHRHAPCTHACTHARTCASARAHTHLLVGSLAWGAFEALWNALMYRDVILWGKKGKESKMASAAFEAF
jgi:hypothetical protein